MVYKFILAILFITLFQGCSNVSKSDAPMMDIYSLCFAYGKSGNLTKTNTLQIVSTELHNRGTDLSNNECRAGTRDGLHQKLLSDTQDSNRNAQLQSACIASGGTWFINHCEKNNDPINVNVHYY